MILLRTTGQVTGGTATFGQMGFGAHDHLDIFGMLTLTCRRRRLVPLFQTGQRRRERVVRGRLYRG